MLECDGENLKLNNNKCRSSAFIENCHLNNPCLKPTLLQRSTAVEASKLEFVPSLSLLLGSRLLLFLGQGHAAEGAEFRGSISGKF